MMLLSLRLCTLVLVLAPVLVLALAVSEVDKPACMRRRFSQRALGFGALVRRAGDRGRLSFPSPPSTSTTSSSSTSSISLPEEVLHMFLRIHPRDVDSPGYDPYDVPTASSLSLARTLDFLDDGLRNRTTVSVFLNSRNQAEYNALENWTNALFMNRSLFVMTYECPLGNTESYNCMVEAMFSHHQGGIILDDDIVYFVEDDYLHVPDATRQLVDIYSSHDPCFAVPYDYADRYFMSDFNDDDGHITIIAGKDRHWRTIFSTTVTFSARFATLNYFFSLDMVPHPKDDYFASRRIADTGASIISPMPSLSAHIESYGNYLSHPTYSLDSHQYVPLYYDWFEEAENLLQIAKQMEWNLWTLVRRYSNDTI